MVQPPPPPKPPPPGDGRNYMKKLLDSQLTDEQKVGLLKDWIKEDG